jgi:hypothetical protein
LAVLLSVTLTAGYQKIFHEEASAKRPRIGFLQIARELEEKKPGLVNAIMVAEQGGSLEMLEKARKALHQNRVLRWNNLLDAWVAGAFLCLVVTVVAMSVRQWIGVLTRATSRPLREEAPHWLTVAEAAPAASGPRLMGIFAMIIPLLKGITDQGACEREAARAKGSLVATENCACGGVVSEGAAYERIVTERFSKPNRCC